MSALTLKIIACICMLCDHIGYIWAGKYAALMVLRYIGRLAFPIYVFLIVNGYRHTHSKILYAIRLSVFALISQIPFSLFSENKLLIRKGNVMFTLLFGLLVVWATDILWNKTKFRFLAFLPTIIVFCLFLFGILNSDYGSKGIFLALTFWLFDGKRILTAISMFISVFHLVFISYGLQLLHFLSGQNITFQFPDLWTISQMFSLFALIFIFMYNGKRGNLPQSPAVSKAVQIGFYAFYPVHMMLLYLISII